MRKEIGVSIYPEHSTVEEITAYLTMAAQYNVTKVFSCLLSVDKPIAEIKNEFTAINRHAQSLGMEVVLDVSPRVFQKLGISYDDLRFFAELEATGIRLDEGFDGNKEAKMTYNSYGLDIEVNMSNDVAMIDNIMSYRPNTEKLIACHNFYPQQYTGLELAYFMRCSRRFKKYNIKTSAFVSSQAAQIGPWPVMEGLCTLEMHRDLPIAVQAKHLFATGLIDVVIIGNMFASEAELKALASINPHILELTVDINAETTELERDIILNAHHFRRGDTNEYMVRSTMSRVVHKDKAFPAHHAQPLRRGDLMIGNDAFGQYKGELHLMLSDLPKDTRKNVVGRVVEEECFLLDYLEAWDQFRFVLPVEA